MLAILTAFFAALGKVADAAQPGIADYYAQKHEREHQERMAEYGRIAQLADPQRTVELDRFCRRLCGTAGVSPGLVAGASIEVPVEHFNALVAAVSEGIAAQAALQSAAAALAKVK